MLHCKIYLTTWNVGNDVYTWGGGKKIRFLSYVCVRNFPGFPTVTRVQYSTLQNNN